MTTKSKTQAGSRGKAARLKPRQGAAIRANVDAASKAAHPLAAEAPVSTYTLFLNNPGTLQVGRRCVEIYNEWLRRKRGRKYAGGAHYFATHVDAVMEAGGRDGAGLASWEAEPGGHISGRTPRRALGRLAPGARL